ncbi:hypothetical protein DFH09DRAFT_866974, partial [Mycena vulgaris]
GETSKVIGRMQFLDETIADLGYNFHMIPYDVLMKHLLKICRDSGVQLRFQTEVTSVIVARDRCPAVVTTQIQGERIEGDMLVGADRRGSMIHDTIAQQPGNEDED